MKATCKAKTVEAMIETKDIPLKTALKVLEAAMEFPDTTIASNP